MMKKPEHPLIDPTSTVIIENTHPGFIITYYEEYQDTPGTYFPVRYPIQDDGEGLEGNFEAVQDMLWRVLEVLHIHNNKHAKQSINIEVIEQD